MSVFDELRLNKIENVYEQIIRHVKREILAGRLVNGDRLPSRRDTAMILSVNPNTVQKAYKLLEDEGLLTTDKNAKSCISIDDSALEILRRDEVEALADRFVSECMQMGLDMDQVTKLLVERWEGHKGGRS